MSFSENALLKGGDTLIMTRLDKLARTVGQVSEQCVLYGISIAACIMVLKKGKPDSRNRRRLSE